MTALCYTWVRPTNTCLGDWNFFCCGVVNWRFSGWIWRPTISISFCFGPRNVRHGMILQWEIDAIKGFEMTFWSMEDASWVWNGKRPSSFGRCEWFVHCHQYLWHCYDRPLQSRCRVCKWGPSLTRCCLVVTVRLITPDQKPFATFGCESSWKWQLMGCRCGSICSNAHIVGHTWAPSMLLPSTSSASCTVARALSICPAHWAKPSPSESTSPSCPWCRENNETNEHCAYFRA